MFFEKFSIIKFFFNVKKKYFLRALLNAVLLNVIPLCLPASRHGKNKSYYCHFRIRETEAQ